MSVLWFGEGKGGLQYYIFGWKGVVKRRGLLGISYCTVYGRLMGLCSRPVFWSGDVGSKTRRWKFDTEVMQLRV